MRVKVEGVEYMYRLGSPHRGNPQFGVFINILRAGTGHYDNGCSISCMADHIRTGSWLHIPAGRRMLYRLGRDECGYRGLRP